MFIISITGGSGSGKTSIAKAVSKKLGDAPIVPMDSFYVEKPNTIPHFDYNFDTPDSLDLNSMYATVQKLMHGAEVTIPEYDFVTSSHKGFLTLRPADFLIMEGLFCLYNSSLNSLTNFSVFVDCDLDVLLARKITRDVEQRNREATYAVNQYFKFTRHSYYRYVLPYKDMADLAIQNCMGRTVEDTAELILSSIDRVLTR